MKKNTATQSQSAHVTVTLDKTSASFAAKLDGHELAKRVAAVGRMIDRHNYSHETFCKIKK